MSHIRCIYREVPPDFPATDQHPDAVRFGPIDVPGLGLVFADALGGEPSADEIAAIFNPPAPTAADKLAAAGLSVEDLKSLLGLPV
jgi:hypothetical protein